MQEVTPARRRRKKEEEKVDLLLDAAGVSTPDWLRQEIRCGPSHQERSLREPPNLLGMTSVMASLELQSAKAKLRSVDVVSCGELLLLGLVAAANTTRTKQNVHQSSNSSNVPKMNLQLATTKCVNLEKHKF